MSVPSVMTLHVHEERVALLLTRLERLALDEAGVEALHEARELLTILAGWESARRMGLTTAVDDADKATVYRRINSLSDRVAQIETATVERIQGEE